MAARRVGAKGKLAEFIPAVRGGAELPVKYSVSSVPQLASTTVLYKFKTRNAGRFTHISAEAELTGTVTLDILKNGASVLVAGKVLTDATTLELEGFGADATGPAQNFDTDTAAHRAELLYEDGDEWTISLVTAGASTILSGLVILSGDEQQTF